MPISEYYEINKEKLTKELLEYYRKEVNVILDLRNDINRPESRYTELRFVGIKSENNM